MTVMTETSLVDYVGNGSTTTFAIPYPFLGQSDFIVVLVNNVLQGLNVHYQITGTSVVFFVAPASGAAIRIYRDPPITQLTDYSDNDPFPASATENALDKLTMIDQRLFGLLEGKLSGSGTGTSTDNAVVRWDGTGGNLLQDSPGITISDQMRIRLEGWTPVYDLAANLMAVQVLQHPIGYDVPDGKFVFLNRISMPSGGYIPVSLGGIAGASPAVSAGHGVYMEMQADSDPTSALYSYITAISNKGPGSTKAIYGRSSAQAGSTGVVMGLVGAIDVTITTANRSSALELDCSSTVDGFDHGNLILMQQTGGGRIRYGMYSFDPISVQKAYLSLWMGPTSDPNARAVQVLNGPPSGVDAIGADVGGITLNGTHYGPALALTTSGGGILTVTAPSVAGAGTITLPMGTTNFGATGGAARVVMQETAGGPFTVRQLTSSDISGGGGGGLDAEGVDDRVAALLVAGTNITLNYNDAANTLTINALVTGGGGGDVTAAAAFGFDNRLIRSDSTAKGVQASLVTLDDTANMSGVANLGMSGVLTLSGGTNAASPPPRLVISDYIDNAGAVSLSHLQLFTNYGFGVSAAQFNYFSNGTHNFYTSADLTNATLVIHDASLAASAAGNVTVHGGLGATGQISTNGRFVNTATGTSGPIGCYFQATLTQANPTDTQDVGLAAVMDVNMVSAANALSVRAIQQVVSNNLTGGGKILNMRLQEMTYNANAGTLTGTASANFVQITGSGAIDIAVGLDIALLGGAIQRGIWDRVAASVWKHDGTTNTTVHDAGAIVVAGGVGIGGNLIINGVMGAPNGSPAAPSYMFRNSTGSGMYLSATNTLSFATAGAERLRIGPGGGLLVLSPSVNIIAPTGNTHIVEIGSLTEAGTAILDLHSSLPAQDFDVRIQCTGGTTSAGNGELLIWAGNLRLNINAPPSTPADGSFWMESNAINGFKVRLGGVTRTVTLT